MVTETKAVVFEYPLYLRPGKRRGPGWRKPWSIILRSVDIPIIDIDSDQWVRSPAQIENGTVMEAPVVLETQDATMEEILETIDANHIEYALDEEGVLFEKRKPVGE